MKWELVIAHTWGESENSTYRLKIPEGWLYRYGSQLVFVPKDPTRHIRTIPNSAALDQPSAASQRYPVV